MESSLPSLKDRPQDATLAPFTCSGEPTAAPAAGELVSVIIPAYNAERSIHETLLSVRSQTHADLEIIVVDDGSADTTADIVDDHMAEDSRILLLRQSNAGVASARNRGIAAARGRYFAPIDADDLWAPDKIKRQLEAANAAKHRVGLVYSWFMTIDSEDRVLEYVHKVNTEGNMLRRLCEDNFVGNGSSPLILRSAALAVGGYDPSLRRQGAEGSEDYKLYLQIAEAYPFALVRDYLTGYRIHAAGMSQNIQQMNRSRAIVTEELARRQPDLRFRLRQGNMRAHRTLLVRQLKARAARSAIATFTEMFRTDPLCAAMEWCILVGRILRAPFIAKARRLSRGTGEKFTIGHLEHCACGATHRSWESNYSASRR
nr:glycosyltransferase family 2 protein [Sphingobium phenoxybenzoativorans]